MTLALYRTYRPGRFADVIGQEHVTVPLQRALKADKTHHAYLFSGPRGCGKTSSARILARSLNCENGPTDEPCGTCTSCIELAPNGPGSIDVIELDAASSRGIDSARELREQAMYAPAGSRFRIYIIDEAHQLTTEAANALLKLVEEPPAHLRFVFATTEPDKLLATIRSRTHHYPFRLVPSSVLQEHLAKICEQEGVKADSSALALAAKAGSGSVRDALSVLGQLVAGAGKEGITYEQAVNQLGFTADALLDDVISALIENDGALLFRTVDAVVASGHDPRRFTTDLLERLRDLIVIASLPDASGLVSVPTDRYDVLLTQAKALGTAALSRAADLVSDGLTALRGATSPRLYLELLAARLLVNAREIDFGSLLARLDAVERRLSNVNQQATSTESAPQVQAPPKAAPPKLSTVAPLSQKKTEKAEAQPEETPSAESATKPQVAQGPVPDIAAVQSLWPVILQSIQALTGGSRLAWMAATNGYPTSVNETTLTLTYTNPGPITMARNNKFEQVFAQAVSEVLQRDLKVVLEHNPDFVIPTFTQSASSMTPKPVGASIEVSSDPSGPQPKRKKKDVMEEAHEVSDDDPIVDGDQSIDLMKEMFGAEVIDDSKDSK
ncbi:MAG: hypothetical protein RIS09_1040 [Actinomycetota bacterium]